MIDSSDSFTNPFFFRFQSSLPGTINSKSQILGLTKGGEDQKAAMQDEIFNLKRDLNAMFFLCGLLIMLNILSLFFLLFDK